MSAIAHRRRVAMFVPGGVDRSLEDRVIPVVLWVIERLARANDLHVIALRQYRERCDYPLLGATVHNLGVPRWSGSPSRFGAVRRWRWLQEVTRIQRATGPWDLCHAFWATEPGWLAVNVARRTRIPSIVTLGGGELVALPRISYGSQCSWRSRRLVRQTLTAASCVTCATDYMRSQAASLGHSVTLVPLGVDGAWLSAATEESPGPARRLVHVASLNPVKDQATLLEAMRLVVDAVPDVTLDIVGRDTLHGAVQAHCRRLGLDDRVSFHGFVPNRGLRDLMARAHVHVMSSMHESAGIAVLEAAACGVPTVGTMVGHVSDWHGTRALGVAVGDARALADAIVGLVRDDARRRALGDAARTWVETFDADNTAHEFAELYESLGSRASDRS